MTVNGEVHPAMTSAKAMEVLKDLRAEIAKEEKGE